MAVALVTAQAHGACLDVERVNGTMAYWVNRCQVFIDVTWYDQSYCASRPGKKYPCSWHVGAGKRVAAAIGGHVYWIECKSLGGLGDMVALENPDGTVSCRDWGRRDSKLTRLLNQRQRPRQYLMAFITQQERDLERLEEEREFERSWRRRRNRGPNVLDTLNDALERGMRNIPAPRTPRADDCPDGYRIRNGRRFYCGTD